MHDDDGAGLRFLIEIEAMRAIDDRAWTVASPDIGGVRYVIDMASDRDIEIARERVRRAEASVDHQSLVVEQLRSEGRPTVLAEDLLRAFELALAEDRGHLARLITT